jgi:ectoine hydroxylase-related dioxygenase (phytanoyl-CoA dioxygenase family)
MATDLSTEHQPLGDLFSWPESPEEWQQYALSDEQVDFFKENGYVAGVPLLDDEQIQTLRDELERFFDPDHDGRDLWYEYHANESSSDDSVLFHSLGAWRISKAFHDVLWNPSFLVPASQLLAAVADESAFASNGALPQHNGKAPVRFWHDQLFCKPAQHGGVVAWHQDYSYWTRTHPMAHLTCWTGLDRATTENGCMHYVPGSHRWDLLPLTDLADNMEAIHDVLSDEQEAQFDPVPIELEAGEATFHHPRLVHGSYENRSDRPRRGLVLNVIRDGVQSATDEHILEGVPAIPEGEKMEGQFFPLLFDPQEAEQREAQTA